MLGIGTSIQIFLFENRIEMNPHVEFRSSAFPKYENEDEETVNSNRWGKRLAEFVRDHLPSYGVATGDILCEDWGWLVFTTNDEFPLWIGCGPIDEVAETGELRGSQGTDFCDVPPKTAFCMFVAAEPSIFKRLFKRIDTTSSVSKVVAALRQMVSERDEFQEVQWTDDIT